MRWRALRAGKPSRDSRDEEIAKLRAQVGRLEQKLEQAALIIDVQNKSCDATGHLFAGDERQGRMSTVLELAPQSSCLAACATLSVSRASFYRWRRPTVKPPVTPRRSPRALSAAEGQAGEIKERRDQLRHGSKSTLEFGHHQVARAG